MLEERQAWSIKSGESINERARFPVGIGPSPRGASDLNLMSAVPCSLPRITNYLPNSFDMSGATTKLLARRQFFRSAWPTARREPYRCFSSSIQNAQQQNTSPPPGQDTPKTTHFGFETIAEALKEEKGSL